MRTCSLTKTIWDEDFLGNRVPLNYHFERHFPIWKVSFFVVVITVLFLLYKSYRLITRLSLLPIE
ncbi:hypothetical protein D923_02165 [Enterococcus faecalis 06-MB-S-04]|nr:hypothetical protein D923_02165 [Enterococcus faecalis 06-MB-S-04]